LWGLGKHLSQLEVGLVFLVLGLLYPAGGCDVSFSLVEHALRLGWRHTFCNLIKEDLGSIFMRSQGGREETTVLLRSMIQGKWFMNLLL